MALSTVGSTTAGLVFRGESAGDRAGESVSSWEEQLPGLDDLIIGAPGATTTDEFGHPIAAAGYVYAIQGVDHLVSTELAPPSDYGRFPYAAAASSGSKCPFTSFGR